MLEAPAGLEPATLPLLQRIMLCQLSYGAEIHAAAEKINKKQQTNVILFDDRAVVDCRLRATRTMLVLLDW